MPQVTVIAKIVAKPEQIEKVRDHCLRLVPPTLDEKGCINYDLYQDNTDPRIFLFHENWDNEDDLNAHSRSPHLKAFKDAAPELVDEWQVLRMTKIS